MAATSFPSIHPSAVNRPSPPPHPLRMWVTIANRVLRNRTEASGAREQSYVAVFVVSGKQAFEALDHHRKSPTPPKVATQRGHVPGFQLGVKSSSHSSPDASHVWKQAFQGFQRPSMESLPGIFAARAPGLCSSWATWPGCDWAGAFERAVSNLEEYREH